jgi:CxxC motif-containing protein (DUF1111 family)
VQPAANPPAANPIPANPPVANPPAANPPPDQSLDGFGQPLSGLSASDGADFLDGRDDFKQAETSATGLGPIFNNVSCVACHARPSVGGASNITVTRFGRSVNGVFDPLTALGGTLLHERTTIPALQEVVPASANIVIKRQTTPLYGLGLIEAIDDGTIIANTTRPKPAGVGGKVGWVTDLVTGALRVGRFGWKAQHADLLDFSADAYSNEMGITNRLFPHENAPNGKVALLLRFVPEHPLDDEFDAVTNNSGIDKVTNYIRLLAPPPRGPVNASALRGQQVFAAVGCASCHEPTLTTGDSTVAALNQQPVELYSDLLLHDMGTLGDGIAQAGAAPTEMRTAPLWGLRASGPYLHDGRAQTVEQAILAHDGEAAGIRDAYGNLSPGDRNDLLADMGLDAVGLANTVRKARAETASTAKDRRRQPDTLAEKKLTTAP